MNGDLYVVNDYLYGIIEFISRETYLLLHEEHWHWSLLTYKDENYKEWYVIVYGTGSLVNHHNQAGVMFEVVEDPEGARDKAFKISYMSSEKDIDHGNCLSFQTVLSLQVDRVVIEETEADDAVFGRLDLIQSSLNVWGPALARYTLRTYAAADQIFINYGKAYALTGLNLYSYACTKQLLTACTITPCIIDIVNTVSEETFDATAA